MSENAERAVLAGGLLLDHAATASPPRWYFFMVHRADLGEEVGGTGYRSEIFHTSEVRRVAGETIRDINAPDYWPGKVVTCVSKAGRFWEGAPKQQDYSSAFQSAARRPSRARASRLPLPEPREGGRASPTRRSKARATGFAITEGVPPPSAGVQAFGVPADVVADEGRHEVVRVVVARLHAQGQRHVLGLAGFGEQLRAQLVLQELVGVALVDQDVARPAAARHQGAGIMLCPRFLIGAEIGVENLLSPRHLGRRHDRREG